MNAQDKRRQARRVKACAVMLTTDGKVHIVKLHKRDGLYLKAMQAVVGGNIEPIEIAIGITEKSFVMLVNEEGLVGSFKYNRNASALYGQELFGNALIVGRGNDDFKLFSEDVAYHLAQMVHMRLYRQEISRYD